MDKQKIITRISKQEKDQLTSALGISTAKTTKDILETLDQKTFLDNDEIIQKIDEIETKTATIQEKVFELKSKLEQQKELFESEQDVELKELMKESVQQIEQEIKDAENQIDQLLDEKKQRENQLNLKDIAERYKQKKSEQMSLFTHRKEKLAQASSKNRLEEINQTILNIEKKMEAFKNNEAVFSKLQAQLGGLKAEQEKLMQHSETTENITEESEYIARYKRYMKIGKLLNNIYYKKDEGGFINGRNHFHDEGDTIFSVIHGDSRMFFMNGENLVDSGKVYHFISKVGEFYLAIISDSKNRVSDSGSEIYILMDKKGKEIKKLSGFLSYNDKVKLYKESIPGNKNQLNRKYYDSDLNMISEAEYEEKLSNWKLQHQQPTKEVENIMYSMNFSGNGQIDRIADQSGKEMFKRPEDGCYYKLNTPSISRDYEVNFQGERVNQGIFIIDIYRSQRLIGNVFINANIGLNMKFENGYGAFKKGKVIVNYTGSNSSDLYSLEGEKIGESGRQSFRNQEDTFIEFTNANGKRQIVKSQTGNVCPDEFDEILNMYTDDDKKVLIAKNNGELLSIEIIKNGSEG